jgi:hypothetical protein
MLNFLRPAFILSAVLLPFIGGSYVPTFAQERQGCFMVDDVGQLIDLSAICPAAVPVQIAEQQTLGTGDIQATLRWTSTDDLDLAVTDPSGQTVTFFNPNIASGGQLDVDANAACGETTSSPIENIFWPPSQAPQGQYTLEINLFSRCGTVSGPISYTLTLLVQGNTETFTGTVDDQNPIATYPFTLPR